MYFCFNLVRRPVEAAAVEAAQETAATGNACGVGCGLEATAGAAGAVATDELPTAACTGSVGARVAVEPPADRGAVSLTILIVLLPRLRKGLSSSERAGKASSLALPFRLVRGAGGWKAGHDLMPSFTATVDLSLALVRKALRAGRLKAGRGLIRYMVHKFVCGCHHAQPAKSHSSPLTWLPYSRTSSSVPSKLNLDAQMATPAITLLLENTPLCSNKRTTIIKSWLPQAACISYTYTHTIASIFFLAATSRREQWIASSTLSTTTYHGRHQLSHKRRRARL